MQPRARTVHTGAFVESVFFAPTWREECFRGAVCAFAPAQRAVVIINDDAAHDADSGVWEAVKFIEGAYDEMGEDVDEDQGYDSDEWAPPDVRDAGCDDYAAAAAHPDARGAFCGGYAAIVDVDDGAGTAELAARIFLLGLLSESSPRGAARASDDDEGYFPFFDGYDDAYCYGKKGDDWAPWADEKYDPPTAADDIFESAATRAPRATTGALHRRLRGAGPATRDDAP
ncbi:hypothetical protein M885DRAFT_573124 [Pelagophyceae sp. CCMP2097]|nr:hypothetical protein M885DRAFT_573124 [Pelagophyceae sp. CCMP2097]